MKQAYKSANLQTKTLKLIESANAIIAEYLVLAFTLTIRQIHYQFVTRGLGPNTTPAYRRLSDCLRKAREQGLVDWDAIEDRTRPTRELTTWASPFQIVESAAAQYRLDAWADQPRRVVCWAEKQAVEGVLSPTCGELGIPYFSTRGFSSATAMQAAGKRFAEWAKSGQEVVVLYLGDHDPSGMNMSEDVVKRLRLYMGDVDDALSVRRIALNMEQIRSLDLPPNLAKEKDSRFARYAAAHGSESWELDALDPRMLSDLVRESVEPLRDLAKWNTTKALEDSHRATLQRIANNLRGAA